MEISDRINRIDRILKDCAPVPVNGAVHGADGVHDGCTKGPARGYGDFLISSDLLNNKEPQINADKRR